MKKITLLFAVLFFAAIAVNAQKIKEKVQVQHNGTWYAATILKINADDGTYFITYDGWDAAWDEWVTKDKIKDYATDAPAAPLTKFKVGDKVEVEYGMIPEPATVVEVGENKYHIKYDKTGFGDKWVTEKQIKKL